jgi:hypothetical protein
MRSGKLLSVLAVFGVLVVGVVFWSGVAVAAGPPETPVTEAASGLTATSAVLHGTLNPKAKALAGWYFAYSTEPVCTGALTTPVEPEVEVQAQPELFEVGALQPHKSYSFCLVATNSTGVATAGSAVMLETLGSKPSVDAQSASDPNSPSVTLEAQINPNNQETKYVFQYANNEALTGATTVPGGSIPAGFGDQPASVSLGNGLTPGVYYYRVVAENSTGSSEGPVQSFARTARPVLGVTEAQDPTASTVLLSGTVNPQGIDTTYRFEIVSEAVYQAALARSAEDPYASGPSTPTTDIGSDYATHPTGEVIAKELLPGTTYHYALVATNQKGTTIGSDGTFTTGKPTPPAIATGGAENVTQNTASITATINTEGLPTTYGFEIGLEAGNYGPPTGLGSVGAGANQAEVALALTGLQPGSTYHYRITATSADGTSYGADQSFTTGVFAIAFATPPAPLPFVIVPSIAFPSETGTPVVKKKTTKKPKKHKKSKGHGKPVKHKQKK